VSVVCVFLKRTRDSKIDQLNPPHVIDHDVAGLKVSVNDRRVVTVKVVKHFGYLLRPGYDLVFGERLIAFLEQLLKIFALDILHNQEVVAIFLEVIKNVNDIRMLQPAQYKSFTLEEEKSFFFIFLPEKVISQFFDNTFSVRQPEVSSHVDRAHAALTEVTENFPTVLQNVPTILSSLTAQVAGTLVRVVGRF
jgi:hypothetical protein